MRSSWSKGYTKETHPSVRKISETMKRLKVDNIRTWRDEMRRNGLIKSEYPLFKRDGDLAELLGVTLGDGHICKFLRCESLRITANSNNLGFIRRYAYLIKKIFGKEPAIAKVKGS